MSEKIWKPKTKLGKMVEKGEITLEEIFHKGLKIKEPEIIDKLIPNIKDEVMFIGGSPGKGGGIRRTPTKRTARMHRSGRRYKTSALVIIGNEDGFVGIGKSEGADTREAIEKAKTDAKLNVIPIKRGCGSWECACGEKHSIPFASKGKCGSIEVLLKPSPKGINLCIGETGSKIMKLAGIRDIWSKSFGDTRSGANYILAIFDAFRKMNKMKTTKKYEFGRDITKKEKSTIEEGEKSDKKQTKGMKKNKSSEKKPGKKEKSKKKPKTKKKKPREKKSEKKSDKEKVKDDKAGKKKAKKSKKKVSEENDKNGEKK